MHQQVAEPCRVAELRGDGGVEQPGVGENGEGVGVVQGCPESFRRDDVPPDVDADLDGDDEPVLDGGEEIVVPQQLACVEAGESAQRVDLDPQPVEHLAHSQFVDHDQRLPSAIAASSSRSNGAAHTSTSSAIRPTRLSNSTRAGSSLL